MTDDRNEMQRASGEGQVEFHGIADVEVSLYQNRQPAFADIECDAVRFPHTTGYQMAKSDRHAE